MGRRQLCCTGSMLMPRRHCSFRIFREGDLANERAPANLYALVRSMGVSRQPKENNTMSMGTSTLSAVRPAIATVSGKAMH
jgi:hypothetical protein